MHVSIGSIFFFALAACHLPKRGEAGFDQKMVDAAALDSAGDSAQADANAALPNQKKEEAFCVALEHLVDREVAKAREITSDPNPSYHDAVTLAFIHGPVWQDPGFQEFLKREGLSLADQREFLESNPEGVARCTTRYEKRREKYTSLFEAVETISNRDVYVEVPEKCGPLERIPKPLVIASTGPGNCGSTHVIDANGRAWSESGCENGDPSLCGSRQLNAKGLQLFRIALAKLRAVRPDTRDGGPLCTNAEPDFSPASMSIRFLTFDNGSRKIEWALCTGVKLERVYQDMIDSVID